MSMATQPGSTDLLLPIGEPGDGTHPYTVHTYYFGFTIPEAQIGAYLYFRAQPAFGLCQGGPVIFRGMENTELLDADFHDYRATMPWPRITGNTITVSNGYVIEWPEPGRLARLRYRSPDGAVSFELEQRAITPLLARGHIVPGEDDHHTGANREPGGSEQFMHVVGELNLRGQRLDVDCLHVRDRSWNQVRTEDPGGARPHPPLGWTPICFGEDLALQTTSVEPEDTNPAWKGLYRPPQGTELFFNSWVVRKGEPRKLVSVRRTVRRYHPVLHSAVEQELEAVDETGERYHFHGEALAQTPMHSWPNIAFRDSVFRWTDLMDGTNRVTHCTYQEICYDAYIRGPRHVRGQIRCRA
jgi:hypothetical protein